ncbi:MAG: Y-family DNA polymerase [Gammaproteobacteria bacterium]|nr:Y-family DNA polymerase [Gammaproteobacteria bacterium]
MIALVDCNSCYASCEQIFRPDLRDKPVIVLSNNDGCIIARSREAKLLGVPDLQPFFKLEPQLKKHGVVVFSANFRLYGDISNQVMATLRDFSPHVEQYSIDEMFLDFSGMPNDLNEYGLLIRQTLWNNVRMPVGVGIAPSKTLSKLANHAAKKIKPNGVALLDTPAKWQWLQKRLPIIKVWGIGKRLSQRLNALGIHNAYQLAQADPRFIRRQTSINVERTICELNGEACIGLEEQPAPKKEIFVTRSFGHKTSSREELLRHISRYAAAACEKLRSQNSFCSSLYLFAFTSEFKPGFYHNSVVVKLPYPSSDSSLIIEHARRGIASIYRTGSLFAKCGIGLLDIRDRHFYQQDLFSPGQHPQTDQLMQLIDSVNQRYGRDSITFGAEGLSGKWTMRQQRLSPSYTSSWGDLPKIYC